MHVKLPAIPLPIVTHSELQGWALHAVARGGIKKMERKTSLVVPAARGAADASSSCWRRICSKGRVRGRRNYQEWWPEGLGTRREVECPHVGHFPNAESRLII